jgi:hypothetical protein
MLSMVKEALEWLNRAEQAREVAGQLTDPGAKKAVLELAESFRSARPSRCYPGCAPEKGVGEARPRTKLVISPVRSSVKQQARLGRSKRIGQHRGILLQRSEPGSRSFKTW